VDALSRLPDPTISAVASIISNAHNRQIHSRFELEDAFLEEIKNGYTSDPFIEKLQTASAGMSFVRMETDFLVCG
jgi:hypothetical protein